MNEIFDIILKITPLVLFGIYLGKLEGRLDALEKKSEASKIT
jgi:hypothetical protein